MHALTCIVSSTISTSSIFKSCCRTISPTLDTGNSKLG